MKGVMKLRWVNLSIGVLVISINIDVNKFVTIYVYKGAINVYFHNSSPYVYDEKIMFISLDDLIGKILEE